MLIRYLSLVTDDQLTETDYAILKKLDENITIIPQSTISELAEKVYASTTSLHRLVKKLGFDGYTEFRYVIGDYLKQEEVKAFENLSDNLYLKKTLEDVSLTYQLNKEKFEAVVSDMMSHSDLYCFGTGWKQKQIVDNFANDLLYYGQSFKTLRNIDDLKIASRHFDEHSMVFVVSLSGDLAGYRETMEYIKEKGIMTVGVSIYSENLLAQNVEHSLHFVDSSLDLENHHWSSIPLHSIFDQLSHVYSVHSRASKKEQKHSS